MRFVERSSFPGIALLVGVTVLVLALRRPDQFLDPAIWVEEGAFILDGYARRGLASLIEPINGYHNLSGRLLALVAFKTSFAWAPEIAAALAVAFICAVVIAIAASPTVMPWPFLCGLAALLVPSDPEVFGVALYSFWWAGLLLPLALLWDTARGAAWLRLTFIIVGGFSSPLIMPLAVLMALRAGFERNRSEIVAAGLAVSIAAIQFTTFRTSGQLALARSVGWMDAYVGVNQFLGMFTAGPRRWLSEESPGFIVLAVLTVLVWLARKRLSWYFALLVLAWCAVCVATIVRAPIQHITAAGSGPRYFFYPLALSMWLMVWIAAKSSMAPRALLATGFMLAITFIGPNLSRRHEPLHWRKHVEACARSERYEMPVLVESKAWDVWRIPLTGEQCRRLIAQSLTGT
jgi:hypothetical protein